jgi:hypothetical protein
MYSLSFEQRRALPCDRSHRHYFGGSSSSEQKTTNVDARVVGGDASSNVSASGNAGSVQVISTDHGAVDGALKLALAGVEGANQIAGETIASQGGLLTGALKMAGDQQQGFTTALENIKTADVRTLVITGVVVVGLTAVMVLKNKG